MRRSRLPALALAAALALAPAGAAAAEAAAATPAKSCRDVEGRAGAAIKVRVTRSFSCVEARRSIGGWLDYPTRYGPRPWTCTHRGASVARWRCHVRTSFGGTRPLRTYRLSFTVLDA